MNPLGFTRFNRFYNANPNGFEEIVLIFFYKRANPNGFNFGSLYFPCF
jgi:hypothetical protein